MLKSCGWWGGGWVAYKILATALSPNSSFPLWAWTWDSGLGLGLENFTPKVCKKNFCFQLDLKLQYETGGDLSNFMENGEWSLLGENGEAKRKLSPLQVEVFQIPRLSNKSKYQVFQYNPYYFGQDK